MAVKRVCVYCGSNNGLKDGYREAAAELGGLLARRGLGLVYGGGRVGLMGVIADAVLAAGGQVIGVIPEALAKRELAHSGLTELRVVATMHERKALMERLSDGFIAMPGGFGTMDELCEIVTWAQLGIHQKPCGLLNVGGYYDRFLGFLDHSAAEGFILSENRALIHQSASPAELLDRLSGDNPRPRML